MRKFVSILSLLCASGLVVAQSPRLNDKDVEKLIKNVNEDSKVFAKDFKKAVEKSAIRKTSREKDAKQVADRLVSQTDGMAKNFNRNKKADSTLPVIYQTVGQLDKLMRELTLTGVVTSDWSKVKSELNRVSEQFSYTPPV